MLAPIIDPRAAGFLPAQSIESPLPPRCLGLRALQARFAAPPPLVGQLSEGVLGIGAVKPAAVLLGIMDRPAGLMVLLTQRAAHLQQHAGQICLPGGRCDAADTDRVATALREADEEVGLLASQAVVLGCLPNYCTVTGYQMTPVVAWLDAQFVPQPAVTEVAAVFEVPLAFLLDPSNHQRRMIDTASGARRFYSISYQAAGVERFIWGATAAILRNFYLFLAA